MRKIKGVAYLSVILLIVFFANCAKQPVIPGVPINLRATALVGVAGVELRWDGVAGAASYDVTITKQAASGSRETFGPYNTAQTYYLALRETIGAGEFDWTVSARNVAGSSAAVAGTVFTLAGEPEPEPEYGLVLTLEEKPAPFTDRESIPAIYVYGGEENGGASQRGPVSNYLSFNYILGTLAYKALIPEGEARQNMSVQLMVEPLGSGEAKRWPDSDTEFLLDEEGQLVFGINDLGENYVNESSGRGSVEDPLEPGEYYFWARAGWDNEIESTKERFDIVLIENPLVGSIVLKDEEGKVYTTKVCPTSTEVTLVYEVSVEGGEWFSDLCYHFTIAQQGEDGTIETTESGTFTNATAFSTTVTYATECTKYATLTLDGTVVVHLYDNEEATEVTVTLNTEDYPIASHSFVLDMADPTAEVDVELDESYDDFLDKITTGTIVFLAEDTKCLQPYADKIQFEVYVDKGIGSWHETFGFFTEEIVLGEGSKWDNAITLSATYDATKTIGGPDTAWATVVFESNNMDLALITATATVHDCCCEDCTLENPCADCGVGGHLSHATEIVVFDGELIDNAFFSSMLDPEDLFTLEGFRYAEEGATPTMPASPAVATITFRLADAFWTMLEGILLTELEDYKIFIAGFDFYTVEGDEPFLGLLYDDPIPVSTRTLLEVCSGYATKTEVTYVATVVVETEEPTETSLFLWVDAFDAFGPVLPNFFSLEKEFLLDTLPPTLTHFTAFRDQINNESWIEFGFSQKPETAALALTVTASGTFLYDLEDATPISGMDNTYRLETGVTLPYDTVITLGATSTDLAGNVGFATKETTVSLSSSR